MSSLPAFVLIWGHVLSSSWGQKNQLLLALSRKTAKFEFTTVTARDLLSSKFLFFFFYQNHSISCSILPRSENGFKVSKFSRKHSTFVFPCCDFNSTILVKRILRTIFWLNLDCFYTLCYFHHSISSIDNLKTRILIYWIQLVNSCAFIDV